MELRTRILAWFKRQTGLQFRFYTYASAWDQYLQSLKRWNCVTVRMREKNGGKSTVLHEGCIWSFSARGESKEIVLILDDHGGGANHDHATPAAGGAM